MDLKVGDKVSILNEDEQGEVTDILDDQRVKVLTTDGFEYEYASNEVIKLSEDGSTVEFDIDNAGIINKIRADISNRNNPSGNRPRRQYLNHSRTNAQGIIEIDLHLEELVMQPGKLKEWQKIEVQIDHFRRCIEEALELKIPDLIFIHGKGQGRLKTELRNILAGYPGIDFFDASYERYGFGATQIRIRGLYNEQHLI